jgi:hypothetical protein
MTKEEKRAEWERMVSQAQADAAYYGAQPAGSAVFGRRFRERRLAECETILAVDAILRERPAVAATAVAA